MTSITEKNFGGTHLIPDGPPVLVDDARSWQPTKPGPQPHNAGITPGYARRPGDDRLITRRHFRKLLRHLNRDMDSLAEAVLRLEKSASIE